MAMGRRRARQESLFTSTADLARSPGHPFYRRLNQLLGEAGFDRWIEGKCGPHYDADDKPGRPSIPPGTYFRMLLVGYFEGLESQRGIAWRCADSLSLHEFLNVAPREPTPDHSTLTNTRKRLPPEKRVACNTARCEASRRASDARAATTATDRPPSERS